MVMTPRERIAYSAIVDRPALDLPDGVRMPVWVIVNVENWDIRRPMPRRGSRRNAAPRRRPAG